MSLLDSASNRASSDIVCLSIHILRTDTPAIDFDITPLGVNLMEVPYLAIILQKMVRIQLLFIDCMRLDPS